MTARRAVTGPALGWVLVLLAGAAVVLRVAIATTRLPPTPLEPPLVEAAYAGVAGAPAIPVDGTAATTSLQLRLYTFVTKAFDRHADALTATRELAIGATAAIVLGLALLTAILRVPRLLVALVVAALAVSGPVTTLLATAGPAVVAAGWFALAMAAGAAALLRHDFRWITAGLFALLGAAITLPWLLIPVLLGTAAAMLDVPRPSRPWRAVIAGSATLAALGLTVAARGLTSTGVLDTTDRLLVLTTVVVIAALAATVRLLRPAAAGTGLGALAALATGATADLLLPALITAALGLLAVTIAEALSTPAQATPVRAHQVAAGAAALVALAACVAGILTPPAAGPRPDHLALADWIDNQTTPGTQLAATPGVWADLDRDLTAAGRDPGSVRRADPDDEGRGDELLITVGEDRPPGVQLAAFGAGPTALSVLATGPQARYLSSFSRAAAGRQLAGNTRLKATAPVLDALRAGRVDVRAMTLLAGLCGNHTITVATTTRPAAERGYALPDRVLVLSAVDGHAITNQAAAATVVDWMRAQEPPYAPNTVRITPAGVVLSWRIPAPLDGFPS